MVKQTDGYTIKVIKPLDETILRIKKYLSITVRAELHSIKKEATLIINLPAQDGSQLVAFDSILYKGQFKEKKITHDTIKVITDLTDNQVKVQISDSKYNIPFYWDKN